MTADITRRSFDPRKHYDSVIMQQGRVQLDADWDESEDIANEAARRERLEVIGAFGSPDDGWKVANPRVTDGHLDFDLERGVLYLGGLEVLQDAAAAIGQSDGARYQNQPDWPAGVANPPHPIKPPAEPGRIDLVYLEVYQQVVTAAEDQELLEPALEGTDTAVRRKIIARVKVQSVRQSTCEGAWHEVCAAWQKSYGTLDDSHEIVTDATLSVEFETGGIPEDLCTPQAEGGYLGVENQTLRVRVVDSNKILWAFDNAAPLYRVKKVDQSTIEFLTKPKDAHHFPEPGQPIELLAPGAFLPNDEPIADATGPIVATTGGYDPDAHTVGLTPGEAATPGAPPIPSNFPSVFFARVWHKRATLTNRSASLEGTGLKVTVNGSHLRNGDYWTIGVRPNQPQEKQLQPWRYGGGAPVPPDGYRRFAGPLALIQWEADPAAGVKPRVMHDCRPRFETLVELTTRLDANAPSA